MEPLSLILGAAGAGLGVVSDRFATRWPPHEEEEHPPDRRVDWRTVVCGVVGAVALGLLPHRFGGELLALAVFGAWFVTLIVGLATDLDSRTLPDELTLPVLPIALVYALSGLNPFVGGELLLAGMGLLLGGERALGGTLFGLILAGLVLVVLLVTRRVGRKSFVPFGPFLIIGALWAALIRA